RGRHHGLEAADLPRGDLERCAVTSGRVGIDGRPSAQRRELARDRATGHGGEEEPGRGGDEADDDGDEKDRPEQPRMAGEEERRAPPRCRGGYSGAGHPGVTGTIRLLTQPLRTGDGDDGVRGACPAPNRVTTMPSSSAPAWRASSRPASSPTSSH